MTAEDLALEGLLVCESDEEMQEALLDLFSCSGGSLSARSFSDAGLLTYNRGVVLRLPSGAEFQIEVQRSR